MSARLIDEPPLLVLPSLAREIGLNEAMIVQQLHWLGRRRPDRWVERSMREWHRTFPFWSQRTIERVFAGLRELGWVEVLERPGEPSLHRVTPDKVAGVGADTMSGVPPTDCRGSVSKERTERKISPKKILSPHEEPIGFSEWLGYHCEKAGRSVPRAGTSARSDLARTYAALAGEGYELEDFKLATDGVLADDFMQANGHTKPENVLRKSKIAGRIDDGRAAREVLDAGSKYAAYDGEA